jgi:dUTP pyrophosphatase
MEDKAYVKKLHGDAVLPTRESMYAAGVDLHAYIEDKTELIIRPHETVKIGTGLAIQIPKNLFGAIFARSGMATKLGVAPANKVGVCDSDYTGEYIVPLHNHGEEPVVIKHGDRIAQLVFLPYYALEFVEVKELEKTERGDGGFGSTGK